MITLNGDFSFSLAGGAVWKWAVMWQNGNEAQMDYRLRVGRQKMDPSSDYSLFFSILRIFHLSLYPSDTFGPWGKDWAWRQQREPNLISTKEAPLFSLQNNTEALHLSPGLPLSWILLYVNSMYLRRLEGNTASATDSEMCHFSPLTKEKAQAGSTSPGLTE